MYTRRTVTSRPGLSQEEALLSLQDHPDFHKRHAKLGAIRRRGDRWVATILEPKYAGDFEDGGGDEPAAPPKEEKADAPPVDDGGGEPDGDEGPPSDGEGGPPKGKGGEKAEIGQLLGIVQQIADALGIVPPDAAMAGPAGPDAMGPGPGGPPAPSPHGGPMPGAGGPPPGGPPGAPHGTKLKPGEMPNKPGVVPVGSPAFAKVQARSFTASTLDPHGQLKVSNVKADLNRQFPNHHVRQVIRQGEYVRAFLTT